MIAMGNASIKKQRKAKIKQQLKEQRAMKESKEFTDKMREEVANMSEEQLDELSKEIANIINEEEVDHEQWFTSKITGEKLKWMFYTDYLKEKDDNNYENKQ